jgi:NTP pyrophosphatase (non-canonical NTP hydrolase)
MTLDDIATQCVEDSARWFPEMMGDLEDDVFFHLAACAGEVGEAINLVKKAVRGSTSFEDIEAELQEEVVDTFVYLMNVVGMMGFDLTEGYIRKQKFNEARFGGNSA